MSGSLKKGICETIKNEGKEQNGESLGMLSGTWGASLFGNMLVGIGVIRAGKGVIRASEGKNFQCLLIL